MTATSGGGLSLMTETVSMAAIAELPVVFVNVQRPGPATGLATRTAQGDLSMVLSMGHGEFSRAVLTPGTPERAFVAAQKAFYLAEKYQVPVFLLSDQHLADSLVTCTGLEVVPRFQERFLKTTSDLEEPSQVRRYLDTPAGVPPRPVPGLTNDLVVADSHVHDELGHITEDPEVSGRLLARLAGKERRMVADMDLPEVAFDQPASPDVLLIGWGSTHGALRHATVRLRESGLSANHLHFHELHPLDWPRVAEMLRAARTTVCVENNATGQLARLLRSEICFNPTHTVLRWDGRPFYADRLLDAIRRLAP
jgi:2-oxoglutarate ferredoxin oxidoreductase subunit alpha